MARLLIGLYLALAVSTVAEGPASLTSYTLFASGDTMLARRVHQAVYVRGAESCLEDVRPLIESADVALTNLECVVSTTGAFHDKGEPKPFLYRARPEMLDVLTRAGFDAVTTANNHTMDYGPEALMDQLALLDVVGIGSAGSGATFAEASRPLYLRVGDVDLAIISVEDSFEDLAATEDRPGVFHAGKDTDFVDSLRPVLAEAGRHAQVVVVSPHWGDNWTENTTESLIRRAHRLIDLGVDAVLGHSSHHLHGVEIYKGKPIVYDMGSFLFDTIEKQRMRLSAGFLLDFDRRGFHELAIVPLILEPSRTRRADATEFVGIAALLEEKSRELDPSIAFHRLDDRLVIQLEPRRRSRTPVDAPNEFHVPGEAAPLADALRARKSDVVSIEAPEWAQDQPDVLLERGITFLGFRHAEAVRPNTAFVSEVALEVRDALGHGWEGSLRGIRRGGGGDFQWNSPVADGAWMPETWEVGEIGVDRTLVRPPELEPGIWDLYWTLSNTETGERARPSAPARPASDRAPEGWLPVGSIRVMTRGAPEGPAGVAWSGKLADVADPSFTDRTWAALVASALAIVIVAVFVALRRIGRSRAGRD